jgi:hypothetical protein
MAGGNGEELATAVELLGGVGDLGLGGHVQLDAFADADDAPLPSDASRAGRAGRPKGARNLSTIEWRKFILGRYRSPAVFLTEMYSRTPAQLTAELGLFFKFHEGKLVTAPLIDAESRLKQGEEGHELRRPVLATGDAAAMQQAAAIALLPYVHQKLPQAVEISTPTRGPDWLGVLDFEGQSCDDLALPLPTQEAPSEFKRNYDVSEVGGSAVGRGTFGGLANALTYKNALENDH